MRTKYLCLAILSAVASAQSQSLISALNSTSDLSALVSLVGSNPTLASSLASLSNITILAPNNAAISTFVNSSGNSTTNDDLIQAILSYHVLNGTYQDIITGPNFVPTLLEPGQYANVTGGQRVQLNNGTVTSGYKRVSNITTQTVNFTGGVIHVIDRVLTIPTSYTANQQEFNLTAALGVARDLNFSTGFDHQPELTVFMPTNDAWANIGSIIPNLTVKELEYIVGYHILNLTTKYSTDLTNQSYTMSDGQNATITKYNESAIFINQARIVIPDILLANGVMHIIDNLINPYNQSARPSNAAGGPAYSGASSVTSVSYTEGVAGPTSSLATASLQATATGGSTAKVSSSSSKALGWMPRPTGPVQAVVVGGMALALL